MIEVKFIGEAAQVINEMKAFLGSVSTTDTRSCASVAKEPIAGFNTRREDIQAHGETVSEEDIKAAGFVEVPARSTATMHEVCCENGYIGKPHECMKQVQTSPVGGQLAASVSTELDSRKVPWDRRIHDKNKKKDELGQWKPRAKTDPAVVARIEQELMSGQSDVAKALITPPAQVVASPIAPLAPNQGSSLGSIPAAQAVVAPVKPNYDVIPEHLRPQAQAPIPSAPVLMPQPAAPAPVVAPVVETGLDVFRKNIGDIFNQLVVSKKMSTEYVTQLCQHFKVTAIWEVFGDNDKTAALFTSFQGFGFVDANGQVKL